MRGASPLTEYCAIDFCIAYLRFGQNATMYEATQPSMSLAAGLKICAQNLPEAEI